LERPHRVNDAMAGTSSRRHPDGGGGGGGGGAAATAGAATAVGTRGAIAIMTVGYALAGLIVVLGPWRGRRDLPEPVTDRTGERLSPVTGPA
jgi:hypothetical protein